MHQDRLDGYYFFYPDTWSPVTVRPRGAQLHVPVGWKGCLVQCTLHDFVEHPYLLLQCSGLLGRLQPFTVVLHDGLRRRRRRATMSSTATRTT